ncbi:zf-DNL-domain-containing protein [Podospora fimiseda]|uniref:Zf-DNL-domain-containing protein n=1 Tax=Podospora fimiseda TaxID=252190 RepID=A0AAN7H1I0_9PEZI|nr:zf-DNL-domain-containing protein [Podospora fimiseda]
MATKRVTLLTNYLPKLTTLRPPPSSSFLTKRHAHARFAHSIPRPLKPQQQPSTTTTSSTNNPSTTPSNPRQQQPSYELTFTCIPCSTRSRHTISKQGYHHGSVLIACPSCKNRHVISDHLKIFGDKKITIENLLKEKGQLVKKGILLSEDLEFWDDGTETVRGEDEGEVMRYKREEDGTENHVDAVPGSSFRVYGEK